MDKHSTKKKHPPRYLKRLLHFFCDPGLIEELEGDLEEIFEDNLETKGSRYASYKYLREVLHLIRPSVIRKLSYSPVPPTLMFSNYRKVAFRNFYKNKTFVTINVLSMGIGLACCIVAYLNYQHNVSFDTHHEQIDTIYRVNYSQQDDNRIRNYGVVPLPISIHSKDLVYVDDITRYIEWNGNAKIDENYFDVNMGFVTSNFLDVFTFPLTFGDKNALQRKNSVIISTELAMRLFGDWNVIGKPLTHIHDGKELLFTIEGVLKKIPSNSSIQIDALTNIENFPDDSFTSDWQKYSSTFLSISDPSNTENIEKGIREYALKNSPPDKNENLKNYYLDPLKGMAASSSKNDVISPLDISLPWAMEVVPAIIAVFILLIACMTFTNTSIASAAGRLKEIGIRKVMGGKKSQIIFQFLTESIFICFLAILVAIPISRYLATEYNRLLPGVNIELILSNNIGLLLFLIALLLVAGLIAGGYPAFYLSKFQPSKILKGNLRYKSVGRLTKVLLTTQFAFSMLTITASIFFIQNAQYQNNIDLGFDTEKTIVIRFGNEKKAYEPLMNALETNPRITALTGSVDHVGRRYHAAQIKHEGETFDVVGLDVGPDYLETVELTLVQGRDFETDKASDYKESIIVNQRLVDSRGWDNAIGKELIYEDTLSYYVVGVVEDFYFDAFNSPIQPLWIRMKTADEYNYLIAKTSSELVPSVMEEIKITWLGLFNEELRDIKPAEYAKDEAQTINSIILKIMIFMGSIAAIMSMVGFYSLVSLNLFSKMKEIGVRKVLGSSTLSVARVVNEEYIYILIVGISSGSIISYFLIPLLMNSIWATYATSSLWVMFLSVLVMILTCIITVGARVLSTANKNPVLLLKDE